MTRAKPQRRPAPQGQPTVNALVRGLDILRCFNETRRVLGSSEIARLVGLPQPTVWRLCRTLVQQGYLTLEGADGRFRPGLPVLTLGFAALSTMSLAEIARPALQELAEELRGAACLSTRHETSVLFLQRCEAMNALLTINLSVGSTIPLASSGTGWALMAALPAGERDIVIAQLRQRDPELWRRAEKHWRRALEDFPRLGYVINTDVFFPGLTTIAVPIRPFASQPPYTVSVTVLSSVLSAERIRREAGPRVTVAAKALEQAMGATDDTMRALQRRR